MQTPEEKNPQKPNKLKTDKACNKRFSDEQIKSLESIFKVEDKLEQKKKLQIAKDLGLQPRQVAIWFQNRRARWKSKQIEQDYRVLKENYDKLSLDFGDMKREKQSLQMELRELKEKFKNMQKVVSSSDTDGELKENFESSNEEIDHNRSMRVDDVENIVKSFVKTEDGDVRSWDERDDEINQSASLQTWRDLSTAGLFENSSDILDWWDLSV